ncbi:tubulin/FtsZ family protein [Halosimplex pelagicum]|uniref:Tubulin-like protein CetZ n=1 Tax=Halosimplex pelagicum TaxID=869886 RepID=A0A7D5SV40_9EURY|nr:tubulin/FtsZ family protein [Halosimplex pelagicum]QLH81927.1 cell division protein [Halosimplex pelagicum]
MNLAVIGFGNAGGKVVDKLLAFESNTGRSLCRFALAVNSAEIDLAKLDYVPRDNRILIGQTDQRVKGRGAGADPEVGATIARQDHHEIERAMDGVPIHDIDGFLVVAGLGGGTGSGGAPVLAETLSDRYAEPVYGLGVLPSADEGGRPAFNAARSLTSFTEATENLVLFDNDTWRQHGDSVEMGYDRTNEEIARRVVTLLAAGELDGSQISEAAMDSSDVKRTLATGGVSSIAFASSGLESGTREEKGLISRFTNGHDEDRDDGDLTMKVHGLVRKAVKSRLTIPAEIDSAERSLIVVSGPPSEFSQKGMRRAREWLERETDSVEILAGDDPREGADRLSVAVLLSNVTRVDRIDALQDQAVDAKSNIQQQADTREDEINDLITDDGGELDPI